MRIIIEGVMLWVAAWVITAALFAISVTIMMAI